MRDHHRHNIKHLLLRRSLCSIIFRRNKSPPIVPNSLTVATLGSRLGCCCNSPFPFVCAQLQCTSIQSDGFQQLIVSFSRMQSSALLYIYILIKNIKNKLFSLYLSQCTARISLHSIGCAHLCSIPSAT